MAESRSLSVGEPTDAVLHQEIKNWRSENALWRDEINVWRTAHENALVDLAKVETGLHQLADAARRHQDELSIHDQRLQAHEHALARFVQGDERQDVAAVRQQHLAAADQHQVQREQHAEAKRLYQAMMSEMEQVRKALTA